jgi:mannosyltransferase
VPAAATLAVMLWGITAPSYWRDEAAMLSAVSRSLPQLVRLLGHVDAVHGLYYLLLWPVTTLAGTGELVTRLPSALAMTAADLGVALIACRLVSRRAALCAGLVFAILPAVSVQGRNARPYALVTAAATWASYLLLRAVAGPRPRRFAAYGLARH